MAAIRERRKTIWSKTVEGCSWSVSVGLHSEPCAQGESSLSRALYVQKDTPVHRVDFRLKLLWAVSVSLLCYLVLDSVASLIIVFAWIVAVMVYARLIREILFRFARFFLVVAIVSIVVQGIVRGGGTELISFPLFVPLLGGRPLISLEGIRVGALVTLRLLNTASALGVLFLSSSPNQISRSLMKLGLPFKYAILFNMVVRFYPLMASEFTEIQSAQASRAFEVEKGNLYQKFRNFLPILIPTLLSALRKSTGIAITAEMRGLSIKSRRTFIHETWIGWKDAFFILSTLVIILGFLYLKFLGYLS